MTYHATVGWEAGDVATIGEALNLASVEGQEAFRILIRAGTYREKLMIDRPGIELYGEGTAKTIIVWSDVAGIIGPNGAIIGTFATATVSVLASNFRAEGLRIENDWDFPANAARPDHDPAKLTSTQAVALRIDGQADRTCLIDCDLVGYQDTLYTNAGLAYFGRCRIWGHIDFIFGAAQAVFEDCRLICRDRGLRTDNGYVCAPSTKPGKDFGMVFWHCQVEKEHEGLSQGSFWLGRPWHPSFAPDTSNQALFFRCYLDDHIDPRGWTSMNSRPGGVLTTYQPEDAGLFEAKSNGPGAVALPSPTRRFLDDAEAAKLTLARFLGSWNPGGDSRG